MKRDRQKPWFETKMLGFFVALLLLLLLWDFAKGAAPALFFSDLTDGPISGWEKSDSVGVAVTVWGLNFDTLRGTSYVTCGGVNLTNDSNYAEWGVVNRPATAQDSVDGYTSARNLERICFWLDTTMTAGAGSISVTTTEGTSNWLPFFCRETGNIYFISRDGSDSDSGWYADTAGHGNEGPWKLAPKVKDLQAGDVVYFREGVWKEVDGYDAVIVFTGGSHDNGTENNAITVASYPGEFAQIGSSSVTYAIRHYESDTLIYWNFSKLMIRAASVGLQWAPSPSVAANDDHVRFVGNDLSTAMDGGHPASLHGAAGQTYFYFYGNHSHDGGADSRDIEWGAAGHAYGIYFNGFGHHNHVYVGWNEFAHHRDGRGMQFFGHVYGDWMDSVYIHDNFIHDNAKTGAILGGGDPLTNSSYEFMRTCHFYNNLVINNGALGYGGILVGGSGTGGDGGEWYVYNNTFWGNVGHVVEISTYGSDPESVAVKNNIIVASSGKNYYSGLTTGDFFEGNNNCYYNGNDGVPAWDSVGSFETDPKLSSPGSFNFHLQAASPCIDSGATILLIDEDYEGNARPYGSAYDMGAYEWQGSNAIKYPPIRK